jgi:cytochrome c5
MTALDSTNGKRLWQFQTDAGVAAPATTFMYKGKQYLTVLAAGTMFGGGKKGDSLWLFSLNGRIESLPADATGGATPAVAVDLPPGPASRANGKTVYNQFCISCHGPAGTGGQGGGATLANLAHDHQNLANSAWNGKNNMPPFRGVLTLEQLRDVAHYIAEDLFPAHPQ